MENFIMLDGRKIAISEETAENMRKEFKPKPEWTAYDIEKLRGLQRIIIENKNWIVYCHNDWLYVLKESGHNNFKAQSGGDSFSAESLAEYLNEVGATKA